MPESCALVCVAGGKAYEAYAETWMESAREFFRPCAEMEYLILEGEEGWPRGTMYRYHRLLREKINTDYLFLTDADMLVVGSVGDEILPTSEQPFSVTVTRHPGYVDGHPYPAPFEDRSESSCFVPPEKRGTYWCGGFVGGERGEFQQLARMIVKRIDQDVANDITPRFHDETALNGALRQYLGHRIELSPSYCFPEDSSWYETWWPERYEPKILALDKTADERQGR